MSFSHNLKPLCSLMGDFPKNQVSWTHLLPARGGRSASVAMGSSQLFDAWLSEN